MLTTHQAWPITFIGDEASYDPAHVVIAKTFAQQVLWAKTGRRFGVAVTIGERYEVPGSTSCGAWTPELYDGQWYNRRDGFACCQIILEHQPVREVVEVRVDGAPMDASSYQLVGSVLRRHQGCWPSVHSCAGEVPIIEVDYRWGVGFPVGVDAAMGELAFEVLEALAGRNCRLPSTILTAARVSAQRQGVNVDVELAGKVGLPLCDALIDTVNPHGLVTRSRVFSPDFGRRA